eukprot:6680558-Pyramimonas_sp.AAC.1
MAPPSRIHFKSAWNCSLDGLAFSGMWPTPDGTDSPINEYKRTPTAATWASDVSCTFKRYGRSCEVVLQEKVAKISLLHAGASSAQIEHPN